ncbi:golgin subfamily A member 5-like [Manihot esculenta]|uniref:golgin subfamily A member 5-like n=1 Tax=Manihot esculenta TaxID=3983 RepID=UPI001CC4CC05|nr:golgin subfamily A member 5-like [Manihot esculenta]
MDEIKFPKNFVLSRDNIHAIYDAFSAGRSVSEAAMEVIQATSSKKVSQSPAKVPSQVAKPSSRSSKSSRPSGRGGQSSTLESAEGSRSAPASSEAVREASLVITEQTSAVEQVERGTAHSPEKVSGGKNKEASGTGLEIVLIEDRTPEDLTQDAPAPVRAEPEGSEGVSAKTGEKRPAPARTSVPSPAGKKSRVTTGSAPALPPIGKGKSAVAELPLPSSGNALKASDITFESPASTVADLLRMQMFGGVTQASDPRLLALTGLLASSTEEQVSFRSRSREELGNTIREMLLMMTGLVTEVDIRDRSFRESVDRRIEEARQEENISATNDVRGNLAAAREQIQTLQAKLNSSLEALKKAEEETAETAKHTSSLENELSRTRKVLQESDERATALEARCKGVSEQLSSMVNALQERNEALGQKAEVQRQYDALKADFDGLQAHMKEEKTQKEAALARVQVLEQELSASSDRIRDLASSAEEFKLRHDQLNQEVRALECKAQLVREQCIAEYQESDELKEKIIQAGELAVQDYRDSSEFKEFVAEACEAHLAKYLASGEMKRAIVNKALHFYSSGYNRGLREARQAPDIPLSELRKREVDSDGEPVMYGEDDFPMPRGDCRVGGRATVSSSDESELEEEDVEVLGSKDDDPVAEEEDPNLGSEIASAANVESSDPRDVELPADVTANRDNVGEGVLTDVSPLRTIYPPTSPER